MIINKKNKTYQTRSDKPNFNWLDNNWYVIKDNSELAHKIQRLYPKFDFVLDDNGELIDVTEILKTKHELNIERIDKIHLALEDLDKTINRATEDLYELMNIEAYSTIQEVIEQKEKLRVELQDLNKVVNHGI